MDSTRNVCDFSINPLPLIALVVGVLLTFQVSANDSTWYTGMDSLGRVIVDRNVSEFDDGSITSGRVDDKDSGWKLFGGYRFKKHSSAELGRTDLNNDPNSETSFTGQSDGTSAKNDVLVAGTQVIADVSSKTRESIS